MCCEAICFTLDFLKRDASKQQHQQQKKDDFYPSVIKYWTALKKIFAWKQLEPISCLSMRKKIQRLKSPVSCAGLDRITIKGRQSKEPIPFAANRMSKCFSFQSDSRQKRGAVPATTILSSAFASWMSSLMKRECFKLWQQYLWRKEVKPHRKCV